MATTPSHVLLVDCPPPRNDDDGGGGGMPQRRVWTNAAACKKACTVAGVVLFGATVATGLVLLFVFGIHREQPPVYTVSITGVTGLDTAPAARDAVPVDPPTTSPSPADNDRAPATTTTLSPVFNLTFQIDNTRSSSDWGYAACVPAHSRADVSYGDAFLAGGNVPPFCAGDDDGENNRTSGRVAAEAARAWGVVAVPLVVGDELAAELAAGDAAVNVKVTMPTYCVRDWCGGAVLSCKPKIGGGPSPACQLYFLNLRPGS